MLMGGMYGAIRSHANVPDITGGIALGLGVWFFGDELATPLVGLAKGPTAYPPVLHTHALAAHVAYGLVTSAATQTLYQFTGRDDATI
jgi:hypothetical protein